MKIYGYTAIKSDNWELQDEYGHTYYPETFTDLYESQKDCVDAAYKIYTRLYEYFKSKNLLSDDFDNTKYKKNDFMETEDKPNNVTGIINCLDFHVQFEFFSQDINLGGDVNR